jgi:hypothetical protein
MTSTYFSSFFYQGNPDRNSKLWNIGSTPNAGADVMHNVKLEIISVISFLTDTLCQFRGVSQGTEQTKLYLWYSLFQAQ